MLAAIWLASALNALPITTWNYSTQDEAIRHIGPMAQDFYTAFNIGRDDTSISTVDEGGVALAAIQGLYQVVQDKDKQIAQLEARVDGQEKEIKELKEMNAVPVSRDAWLVSAAIIVGFVSSALILIKRRA